ncbi:MAG: class I SAM-dependent rRNA methyltransferase [Planctomycetota bacterium]
MQVTSPPSLKLRKGAERRVLRGHEWVFSNELQLPQNGQTWPESGGLVHLQDYRGKFLASGYFNSKSLIAARVVARTPLARLDRNWLRPRLESALRFREQLYPGRCYRWVHGEADGLPGLVVDRFGDYLTIQITTAGMQRLESELLDLLGELSGCEGIVLRADDHFRELEGLSLPPPTARGVIPEWVALHEGDLSFETQLLTGQKTGWFFDQRDNRQRLRRYVAGARVLVACCYAGAWGITAAKSGASEVTGLDSSPVAIELVRRNAALNQVSLETLTADAFAALKQLQEAGRKFEVVVLDPPALIKRKRDHEAGLQAYYQLNRLATSLLAPDGLLVSCSCSHHLAHQELVEVVTHAARHHQRQISLVEIGQQSADHPIHPAIPETAYLKALFTRMVSAPVESSQPNEAGS